MRTTGPVAVIGGGLTGLVAASRLMDAGVPVVLYEAGNRPGGVIRSVSRDGYLVEGGPQVLREGHPEVSRLLDDVGLSGARLRASHQARRRFLVRGGRLVPVPSDPVRIVTTPLLSRSAKLRLLAEPWLRSHPAGEREESVAEFVRRRFGAEVATTIAEPLVAGLWAGRADLLAARYALADAWRLEREHGSVVRGLLRERRRRRRAGRARLVSFVHGLEALPRALASRLGDRLRCNHAVAAVERTRMGWRVHVDGPGGARAAVHRAIVLAGSAQSLPEVRLPDAQRFDLGLMARMPHSSIAVVGLGFHRAQVSASLDGWGALVPEGEGRALLGMVFSSSIFPGRAPERSVLVTALLGGARVPELAERPGEEIVATALQDMRPLLGLRGTPEFTHVSRMRLSLPQYDLDHHHRLERLDELESRAGRLVAAGAWCTGTGLPAAIRAGQAAASRIQAQL